MDAKVKIEINHGIPCPMPAGTNRLAKYPWLSMSVGDSFLFPPDLNIAAAASNANSAQKRTGFKFSCRTTPEGIRVWRIA